MYKTGLTLMLMFTTKVESFDYYLADLTVSKRPGTSNRIEIHFAVFNNTAVKRNAHVRDLRKRGKNKGKLYTEECGLNKNTKYKKTPENIR